MDFNVNRRVKKVIDDLVECYENGIAALLQIKSEFNDSTDDAAIVANYFPSIRSNEKLITLYGSVLEEYVNAASRPGTSSNSLSNDRRSLDTAESMEINSIARTEEKENETDVEEKFVPSTCRRGFSSEEFVDLANQHVSFNYSVTVVNFSNPSSAASEAIIGESSNDDGDVSTTSSNNREGLETVARRNIEEKDVEEKFDPNNRKRGFCTEELVDLANQQVGFKQSVTVVNFSNPSSGVSESKRKKKFSVKLKDSEIHLIPGRDFSRRLNLTTGTCIFCKKKMCFTKLEWQKHLLTHTKENFYFCKECETTFSEPTSHQCSPDKTTNIFDHFRCVGDDFLSVYVCNFCNEVRFNRDKLQRHIRLKHPPTPENTSLHQFRHNPKNFSHFVHTLNTSCRKVKIVTNVA